MSNITNGAASRAVQILMSSTVHIACATVVANLILVSPSRAAFTETNFAGTQVSLAANAVCGEQLDDLIFGLQTAEIAADFIGLGAEAAGAVLLAQRHRVPEVP